jgi:hypothetical protein
LIEVVEDGVEWRRDKHGYNEWLLRCFWNVRRGLQDMLSRSPRAALMRLLSRLRVISFALPFLELRKIFTIGVLSSFIDSFIVIEIFK